MSKRVNGAMALAAASIVRPSNTTAYAAKDAVSDSESAPAALSFANITLDDGVSGYIVKARLITNQSTNQSRFRLHLFNALPTAINDNAAYTLRAWVRGAGRGILAWQRATE